MKKKAKPKGLKGKVTEEQIEEHSVRNPNLDIILEINDLKILEENYFSNANYDNAIYYAEKVIRLAIKNSLDSYVQEQKEFMKKVAEEVQRLYFTSKIEESGKRIKKIYDILMESGNISQAHEILESFKNHHEDSSYFNKIPLIRELIKKDKKIWLKHQIINQNKE